MNRPLDALVPAACSRMASSAGIATGLVAPLALGAPGNLDTTFADHGRAILESGTGGQAWTVEALDDGEVFVAGGDIEYLCYYYSYYCDYYGSNFANELSADGEIDPSFGLAAVDRIEVRDAVRQSDGKVVLVGRRIDGAQDLDTLAVYRVDADGALDTSFGTDGIFELAAGEYGDRHRANAVALDPDGRIVVAGAGGEQLIVLRLLADGTRDASFGEDGVFAGPAHDYYAFTFIERTDAGGYRLTSTSESLCRVIGLTATGAIDNGFGTAGIAPVETSQGAATACNAMAMQSDGSLLLAGAVGESPFAARLLATGAMDPAFSSDSIPAAMTTVTAAGVDGDDRLLVAGMGDAGGMILRLAPDGSLDGSFGEGGTTIIDLPSDLGVTAHVRTLDARKEGRIVAAGGTLYDHKPFVVQLQGAGGADAPGVLSFTMPYLEATEGGDMVVKVRRTGGTAGSVSVDYATVDDSSVSATAGEDYDEVAGTLTWGDGDATEREITLPVHASSPEEEEGLKIALTNPQGGAGLGQRNQLVSIPADGAPAGQFAIHVGAATLAEAQHVEVQVYRNYYFAGPVSVTLTPVDGTATGDQDFVAQPVTLNWADQEFEPKFVSIAVLNDGDAEPSESFTLELSNPTGGAILGPHASQEIVIYGSDNTRSGGGGSLGWLSLLFLSLIAAIRPRPCPRL